MKKITHFKTLTTSALALAIFAGGALPTFASETTTTSPETVTPISNTLPKDFKAGDHARTITGNPETVTPVANTLPEDFKAGDHARTVTGVSEDSEVTAINKTEATTTTTTTTTDTTEKPAWVEDVKNHTLKAQKENLLNQNSNSFKPGLNPDGSLSDKRGEMMTHAEALAVNPYHFTNVYSNMLILTAVSTGDWSKYDSYQAMRSPLFYNVIDGKFVKNKFYYVQHLESEVRAINEDIMANKTEIVKLRQANLKGLIADFNKAPGTLIPYIVGVNHLPFLAKENGIAEPSREFFESPYNDSYVLSNGKYRDKDMGTIPFYENDDVKDPNNKVVGATTTESQTVQEALTEENVKPSSTTKAVTPAEKALVASAKEALDKAVVVTQSEETSVEKAVSNEEVKEAMKETVQEDTVQEEEETSTLSTSDTEWIKLINASKK